MNSRLKLSCDFIIKQYSIYRNFLKAFQNSLPFIVGICGPQGSGKSTLADQIVKNLSKGPNALKVVTMSLDDFYYDYEELEQLKVKHDNCFTYQSRGPPGTHDITLINKTLDQINKLNSGTVNSVRIPSYNKSYKSGKGDREPYEKWQLITEPIDIILFEGWMVGFSNLSPKELEILYSTYKHQKVCRLPNSLSSSSLITPTLPIKEIYLINSCLQAYTSIWHKLGCFIQLDVADLNTIYEWRLEQEVKNKQGLSEYQVIEFVKRFMPTYEICLPKLRWLGLYNISRTDYIDSYNFNQHLVLQLDSKRNAVGVKQIGRGIQYSRL